MRIIQTIKEMQAYALEQKRNGKRVGVVPTMGFLHAGHMSLVDVAKENSDVVVVTIFVNPTQFAPNEDLDSYPRDIERDKTLCKEHGVAAVFLPSPDEMYPVNSSTWVHEEALTNCLCGASRPSHFRGVTTIVTKLFNAVLPDVAVFGQKDAQQALVLKRMTRDLNFPIDIIIAPIVREADGLAMSSRNKYLSPEERQNAVSLSQALLEADNHISAGLRNIKEIRNQIKKHIADAKGSVDYVDIRCAETLDVLTAIEGPTLIAVAAHFGTTRLIDNIIISL